eukprot:7813640-Karenia_brevis.AAC.1
MDAVLTISHRANQDHRSISKPAVSSGSQPQQRGKWLGSANDYHYPNWQGRHRPIHQSIKKEQS